ncbi:DUF397 domain-containing protein [Streptomyces carpaticus]|uniref:DUF397 domain-containing protein n=1 Tax=Streptomyces TaxID=1883 RepID=UPI00220F7984|nr:DUF397 domain-containing protein [Streptomyces carpaticus]
MTTATESPRWFKSSYSNNGGNCLEIATNLAASHGLVPVRDTKQRGNGPVVAFPAPAWAAFVTAVKR